MLIWEELLEEVISLDLISATGATRYRRYIKNRLLGNLTYGRKRSIQYEGISQDLRSEGD